MSDEAREDLDPEPLRPVPLSLDLKVRFPEWDSDWSDKERERESPTKITPRIRAISIPATPTMAHIQTVSVLDAASLAHSDDIIRSTAFFCRVMMDDCILRTQPMHFFRSSHGTHFVFRSLKTLYYHLATYNPVYCN